MAVLEPLKSGYYVWHYLPSIPAAAIFAVLFALSIVLLSIKMFRTKTYFVIPLLIGVIRTSPLPSPAQHQPANIPQSSA